MSSDFTPDQKRYLEGFASGLNARAPRVALQSGKGEPAGPDAIHIKAQDRTVAAGGKLADQEKSSASSIRSTPMPAQAAGQGQRSAEARRQFPLALLRPVLCRAGAELLHVPAAHPERHRQALAD